MARKLEDINLLVVCGFTTHLHKLDSGGRWGLGSGSHPATSSLFYVVPIQR